MTTKAKIRVIKKKEVENTKMPKKVEKPTKQASAREMVSTVSNWVSEFQNRKRVETKQAFEQLFSKQPQTNSV